MWTLPVLVGLYDTVLEMEQDFYVYLSALGTPHSSLLCTWICLYEKKYFNPSHELFLTYEVFSILHI